jgi:hypothetical protein
MHTRDEGEGLDTLVMDKGSITITAPLVACIATATGERIYMRAQTAQRAAHFGAVLILDIEGDEDNG